MNAAIGNRVVAFARVVVPVGREQLNVLIGRELGQQFGQLGASPVLLLVTSAARTSNVSSSIPICILRQMRRLGPPCLRVCRENCLPDCFLILRMSLALSLNASAVDEEV